MQNGEFGLALVREIERLKISRLTGRAGHATMIREQDLQHALLRASVGTSAQHDSRLGHLLFKLPSGPVRPLLSNFDVGTPIWDGKIQVANFDNIILGLPLKLTYKIKWPLDLFLQSQDLAAYEELFSFLSSLRFMHMRVHTCWSSLSNCQRARRRWTGLDEGGTQDSVARMQLLRCGWGIVRLMGWFMDVLLGYVMIDVVESEFRILKKQLKSKVLSGNSIPGSTKRTTGTSKIIQSSSTHSTHPTSSSHDVGPATSHQIDFTTLRNLHSVYLQRLKAGSLHTQPAIMISIREIFDVCERFMGQVERWGGDVLPALLFEGSISVDDSDPVGKMVEERRVVLRDIDEVNFIPFQAITC